MQHITLNKGQPKTYLCMVDDDLFTELSKVYWSFSIGYAMRKPYPENKTIYMHRTVMELRGIIIPKGIYVDHIDRNKLNNQSTNLRLVTPSENNENSPRFCGGATFIKHCNKWQARVTKNGKRINLGLFKTKEEALETANKARNNLRVIPQHCN